jgi:energy-coupling factor transporter ATP-binding protein EcfA2
VAGILIGCPSGAVAEAANRTEHTHGLHRRQRRLLLAADGRPLLADLAFRVTEGRTTALIGANGAGKSTLLRIIRGGLRPDEGSVQVDGGLGVMDQFVGTGTDGAGRAPTVAGLLVSVAPSRVRDAALELEASEDALIERDDTETQMRYATALAEYAEAGGYEQEVVWDHCTTAALGIPFERAKWRELGTLSGGEQKRLALEAAAARSRAGAAARRARQLARRARQALARGRAARHAEDRAARSRTTVSCSPAPPTASSRSSSGPGATPPGCTAAASRGYHEAREERFERSTSCAGAGTSSTPR